VTAGGQVDCERAYSDECHQERCEPIDKRICRVKFDASKSVNLTTVSCGPVGDCKATTTGPRVLCECLLAPFDRSKAAEVACRCACEDICTVNR
jgi:hypothetical protein